MVSLNLKLLYGGKDLAVCGMARMYQTTEDLHREPAEDEPSQARKPFSIVSKQNNLADLDQPRPYTTD